MDDIEQHRPDPQEDKQTRLIKRVIREELDKFGKELMSNIDSAMTDLTTAVQDVAARVQADIQALRDEIAAGGDPTKVQQIVDSIESQVTALSNIDPVSQPTPGPAAAQPAPGSATQPHPHSH